MCLTLKNYNLAQLLSGTVIVIGNFMCVVANHSILTKGAYVHTVILLNLKGSTINHLGGVMRIFASEFFFGNPPNKFFFSKIDRRIFFNNMVLQGKHEFFRVKLICFGGPWMTCRSSVFFVLHHTPQMINGRPL